MRRPNILAIERALLIEPCYMKQPLFYRDCKEYYYSNIVTFQRFFSIICVVIKVFDPHLLQMETAHNAHKEQERRKIEIIKECQRIGLELLKEHNKKFIGEGLTFEISYQQCFYIRKKSLKEFINIVLWPLLKTVYEGKIYNWIKIIDKKGFCRELEEEECLPIGGEVSLNLSTGKRMLKLT